MTDPKYTVGDKIIIHDCWEDAKCKTYNAPAMDEFLGKEVTISRVEYNTVIHKYVYYLRELPSYFWVEDMIRCLSDESEIDISEFNNIIGAM